MIKLSIWDTFLSVLPVLIAGCIYYRYLEKGLDFSVACARMVLQLLLIGYLLSFLFSYQWSWIGIGILIFMTTVAASIVIRPLRHKSWNCFTYAFVALFFAGGVHLFWIVFAVLKLKPWYQPELVIPLAGMIFANGMNSLSIGVERLESEQVNEVSINNAVKTAFNAAMIPQLNSLLAVGLVALPGMMTGQILSGISPLEAVRYQIMVMSTIVGASAMSLGVYFALHQVFSVKPT